MAMSMNGFALSWSAMYSSMCVSAWCKQVRWMTVKWNAPSGTREVTSLALPKVVGVLEGGQEWRGLRKSIAVRA